MDSSHHKNDNSSDKSSPSKLVTALCIFLAFVLPYSIVAKFNKHTAKPTVVTPIKLPPISNEDPATLKNVPLKKVMPEIDVTVKHIETKPGDTLASVFKQLGINARVLQKILNDTPHNKRISSIKPHQKLQFHFDSSKQLIKLVIPLTSTQKLVVTREKKQFISRIHSLKLQSHLHYRTATIKGSLYKTSKRLQIPYKLLQQMTDIFKWQIDFSRDIRDGDQITLIYKAYYSEDKLIGTGDIIAVKLSNHGQIYHAIRYKIGKETAYFTEQGKNLKKAFDRYPVHFSHISSPFSTARHHPVLGVVRPHRGIDLAARLGTPIRATSNGRITKLGHYGGYGNMIEIKHLNTYSTRYAHMVRFRKGLVKGSQVKRGQIIGYVGQTGLADGPHCHYEFLYRGRQRNPASITLPHAPSIPAQLLAQFKTMSSTLLAQLDLYEEAQLAVNSRKHSTTV